MKTMEAIPLHRVAPSFWERYTIADVREWTRDAHHRSMELIRDLDDRQMLGPRGETVNPLLWEIGHVAWFHERFLLRDRLETPSLLPNGDDLYDSIAVPHQVRWDLPLLKPNAVLRYIVQVYERVIRKLDQARTDEQIGLHLMALFHEDMHTEAYVVNRQSWGYPRPSFEIADPRPLKTALSTDPGYGHCPGDVEIPGGTYLLGASPDDPFVFDNEKWQHPVTLKSFAIAKSPVTQNDYLAFVEDQGYHRSDLWSRNGQQWLQESKAIHPIYWEKREGKWLKRDFDQWLPLQPCQPITHICWYEAEAYCNWSGRRLPTEAEWEVAASYCPSGSEKRWCPWGEEPPCWTKANLDGYRLGCIDVGAFSDEESGYGCRQMIGNTWEWVSSAFLPYPGFVPDPYKEYSQPWFGNHKVVRGGSWLTRSRMIRNTFRSFYLPQRRDVWAGFRTCARSSPS